MIKNLIKTYNLLSNSSQTLLFFICVLMIFAMILEAMSIGIIIPFLGYFFDSSQNSYFYNFIVYLEDYTSLSALNILLIIILAVFLIKNLFLIFNHYINSKFIQKIKYEMSIKGFKTYLKKDYDFFLKNNTAVLLRNLTTEIGSLVVFLTSAIVLVSEICVFIGIISLLLIVDFKSTLIVTLIAFIFSFLIIYVTKNKMLSKGRERIFIDGQINKFLMQGLSATKDVKLLQVEDALINNASHFLKKSYHVNLFFLFYNGITKYLFELLVVILFVGLVLVLSKLDFDYNYILKTSALLGIASFRILPSISRISTSIQQIKFRENTIDCLFSEFVSLKSGNQKMQKEETKGNPGYVTKSITLNHKLNVENLNYSYNSEKNFIVLKNINFEIKKGEFLGIYGATGSGKSTLVNILIGLLKTNNVFIDGRNIFENIHSWQKNIGYVAQDTYLVDDTIQRNIAFGIDDQFIDNNKISDTLDKSQLRSFVDSLPKKLETKVGEKGIKISGGQKQRIGIARALYHNPQVLIFDESTSSLDIKTEQNVLKAINDLKKTKTIIFVTHRNSIIDVCDKVLYLSNGSIKYFGEPNQQFKNNE